MFTWQVLRKFGLWKIAIVLFALYIVLLGCGIGHRTALWDEFQNTALPYFLYDLTHEMASTGGMGFSEIKAYAISYHAHYPIFYSLIHHPPFHRLFLYASFMVLGPGEFAGRIVSVFFSAATLLITYMLALELTRKKEVALLSAVVLALIPTFVEYSRLIMLEVPLAAMTALTVYAFVRYRKRESLKNAMILGVVGGLCLLTKNYGVLVIIPIAAYIAAEKGILRLFDRKLLLSALIAASIAAPWYIFAVELPYMVGIGTNLLGAYMTYFVFSFDIVPLIPSFYLTTFSWILGVLSVAAIARALARMDAADKLMLVWIAAYFVFFTFLIQPSVSSMQRFIIPTLPAFAILCARLLRELIKSKRLRGYGLAVVILLLCGSAAVTVMYNISVSQSSPVEEAVVYAMANSPEGSGIITTNFDQIFYFLKHDRNLSFFALNVLSMDGLENVINSTHATEARMAVGIKNPQNYTYLLISYPLPPRIADDEELQAFIGRGDCFRLEKEFEGRKNMSVYRMFGDCR
jgi:4-amino-4-deoxy-L-arabinose transferase-like glycosyltransferase